MPLLWAYVMYIFFCMGVVLHIKVTAVWMCLRTGSWGGRGDGRTEKSAYLVTVLATHAHTQTMSHVMTAPKAGRCCGSLTDSSVCSNSWRLQELHDGIWGLWQLRSECTQLYAEVLPHRQVVRLLTCEVTIRTNFYNSKVTICWYDMMYLTAIG
jgi:hypothetical protein